MTDIKTTVTAQTNNVPAIFAINPRLKDSTGKVMGQYNTINQAWPATAEQIMSMLVRKDVAETREALRKKFDDKGKLWTLPYICPHYAAFRNDHRAQEYIIPEQFTHKTCIDVDDPEKAPKAIERALALNQDEMSEWQDSVLYIEYSTRKPKAHIWILMPKGKTIEESQLMFCSDLGDDLAISPDAMCFTPERLILMTGDVYYKSDRWLQPLSEEEIEERREAFLQRGLDVDGRKLVPAKQPLVGTHSCICPQPNITNAIGGQKQDCVPTVMQNVVPADARTRYIVRECLKEAELEVKDLNTLGGIHNAVKSMLSVGATQLLTQGELMGVLKELMPDYWQEKNIVQLVNDFYAKYTDTSQKMTIFQRRTFARSRKIGNEDGEQTQKGNAVKCENVSLQDDSQQPVYGDTASLTDIYNSPFPPMLSKNAMPRFVKAATLPVPAETKETAAQAMFPPLGMYCDATFEYIDNTPRESRLNCLVIAGTGSGKDSSTKHMLERIEAPRQEEDSPNRKILADWKAECKRLEGKNEDKPPRPNVSVRSVAANITPARLSELMADSQGRIIHTRMIEFDQFFGLEGWKPGTNCPFTNLKLTDDERNPFGQERVGKDSITYRGPLSINWNASTTVSKAQYYFKNVMTDGPISRLCLATVPDRGLGAPMPRHGRYDEKYDASLRPFIDNLRQAQGLVVCKQAKRMAERLKAELDDYVIQSGSDILDNLGHRALVHAFRKACLLYAANGMKWEKSIETFCRWSLHYDLYLKLHFFGELIRSADGEVKTSHRGPRNLLEQLPQQFTRKNLVEVRLANGMKEDGAVSQLRQWVHRGFITKLSEDKYERKGVTVVTV